MDRMFLDKCSPEELQTLGAMVDAGKIAVDKRDGETGLEALNRILNAKQAAAGFTADRQLLIDRFSKANDSMKAMLAELDGMAFHDATYTDVVATFYVDLDSKKWTLSANVRDNSGRNGNNFQKGIANAKGAGNGTKPGTPLTTSQTTYARVAIQMLKQRKLDVKTEDKAENNPALWALVKEHYGEHAANVSKLYKESKHTSSIQMLKQIHASYFGLQV